MHYCSIFQRLYNFIPRHRFENSGKNMSGTAAASIFPHGDSFLTCLYAQITGKDSLREITGTVLDKWSFSETFSADFLPDSTLPNCSARKSRNGSFRQYASMSAKRLLPGANSPVIAFTMQLSGIRLFLATVSSIFKLVFPSSIFFIEKSLPSELIPSLPVVY